MKDSFRLQLLVLSLSCGRKEGVCRKNHALSFLEFVKKTWIVVKDCLATCCQIIITVDVMWISDSPVTVLFRYVLITNTSHAGARRMPRRTRIRPVFAPQEAPICRPVLAPSTTKFVNAMEVLVANLLAMSAYWPEQGRVDGTTNVESLRVKNAMKMNSVRINNLIAWIKMVYSNASSKRISEDAKLTKTVNPQVPLVRNTVPDHPNGFLSLAIQYARRKGKKKMTRAKVPGRAYYLEWQQEHPKKSWNCYATLRPKYPKRHVLEMPPHYIYTWIGEGARCTCVSWKVIAIMFIHPFPKSRWYSRLLTSKMRLTCWRHMLLGNS